MSIYNFLKRNISLKLAGFFGISVITLECVGVLVIAFQSDFDINLPLSYVFSDYSQLNILAKFVVVIIAMCFLGFSRLVDEYWDRASTLIALSMIAFIAMAFVTYIPGEKFYGTHSLLVIISSVLTLFTIYQTSKHDDRMISIISKITLTLGISTMFFIGMWAGKYNYINFIAELLMLAIYHVWIATIIFRKLKMNELVHDDAKS